MHNVFDSDIAIVPDRVSVIMPMRNPGRFLPDAIASVLNQDFPDVRLIIVDDGSTDGSREYIDGLAESRIVLVDGPRKGISSCMNKGIGRADGEYLMRCDADDVYPPGRIASHVRWLTAHASHIAVCGSFLMIDTGGSAVSAPIGDFADEVVEASTRILDRTLWTHLCAFSFRRDVLNRIGAFREYFETSEDADFLLRLAGAGSVGFVPANAYLYRIHGASITHTVTSARRLFFESLAYQMNRDRLETGTDALMRGHPPSVPLFAAEDLRPTTASEHVSDLLVADAWRSFSRGRRAEALGRALRAVGSNPVSVEAWKALVFVGLKRRPGS